MKRIARLVALLAAVLGVVLALAPARALAAYAARSEIRIDGALLSEGAPQGVTYDETYGELWLENYNGGPIVVESSRAIDLTVILKGENTITSSGSGFPVAGICNPYAGGTLFITSFAPNAGLTINHSHSGSGNYLEGIICPGNVTISGNANVQINLYGGNATNLICCGIYSSSGTVKVAGKASLGIYARVKNAKQCVGVSVGNSTGSRFEVSTIRYVTINLAESTVTGDSSAQYLHPAYSAGILKNGPGDPFVLSLSPKVIIQAQYVYHSVQGKTMGNPSKTGYSLSNSGTTHTYTIAESGKRDVTNLSIDNDPTFSETYWGGHCRPEITVKDGSVELEEMVDYSITFSPDNINCGQVLMTIHGMGSYKGSMQFGGFGITPRSIFDCEVQAIPDQILTSSGECRPKPVVTFNGMTLVEGRDYVLGYADNDKVTTYAMCFITGKGNFEEIRMVPFQILSSTGPYTITVTGGMAKDDGASTITQSMSGEIVNLVYDPAPAGKKFGYWLITPNTVQVDQYGGFIMPAGNVTAKAVYINDTPEPTGGPMYRMYNKWTYEHFYTESATERDNLKKAGWTYEGVGWYAPSWGDPVYRLYNPWAPGGDHHYTTSWDEYMTCINAGWRGEGVGWYSDTNQITPIYREYNPYELAHNHNYTADLSEHQYLISIGWQNEGIAWYGTAYG